MSNLTITIEGPAEGFGKEWIAEAIADLMRQTHNTTLINTIKGQRIQAHENENGIVVILK